MHNLTRLIRLTLQFSDDLTQVFNLDNDEDVKIFKLLQGAYSKSRYNSDFDPDEESIEIILEKVKQF